MPRKDQERHKEYDRHYYAAHRAEVLAYSRKYYAEHGEKKKEKERQRYFENLEKLREGHLKWYKEHREERRVYSQKQHNERRLQVLQHYGGRCMCCGESQVQFLTVDHINGGGTAHRRKVGNIDLWLIKNNFPEGFQLLCWNCNAAKAYYGQCPHKEKK